MPRMRDTIRKAGTGDKRNGRGDRNQKGRRAHPLGPLPQFPDAYFLPDGRGRDYLDSAFVSKENMDTLARHLAYYRMTTGQMRRFFNHCRKIERRMRVDDESWERVSASFVALSYHAQNAERANKIPRDFQHFIDANVKRVVSSKEPKASFLNGFLPHFEALVGFGAAHLKGDS